MITPWWADHLGLDYRHQPLEGDILLANRYAALVCAMKVCGTDPSSQDSAAFRAAANVADKFLDHFQAAATARDGYIRRLTLAIACTSATGKPKDAHLPVQIIRIADMYRKYLTATAETRGGSI